jgi:RNA polymerase sigma-70 factor (ECF subfamily)
MDRVVALLTDDAWLTMPPEPLEYQGPETIAAFLRHVTARRRAGGRTILVPTRANGQPAFGHYMSEPGSDLAQGTGVFVLTLAGDRITTITRFGGSDLVSRFGLPSTMSV